MKIVITGSLGNISRSLVAQLTSNGHLVTVISSKSDRAEEIKSLGAQPAIGALEDTAFMIEVFKDADAVYTMVPPDFSQPDYAAFADTVHQNYAQAIVANRISHVVNLSSIGVAVAGIPPLTKYYNLEGRLDAIPDINVVHLRPAMFYSNFYGSIPMVKQQGIMGHNLPPTVDILMTHPADIADLAFTLLDTLSFSGHQIEYPISDIINGQEVAHLIGAAIGKPVQWIEFPDDALLQALLANGFSHDAAETLVVNAGIAIRQGLFDEFKKAAYLLPSRRKFAAFAKEYAGMLYL